ncbi:helix-turn-helix transcriptional regulator [Thermobifida cellulosilytica]|uniref:DeoR faimly transcriptional regulator n=1 Tax=Thermobifida cellulosilytica TB100 TaxID=665004 RepID=A0A147KJM8_THECS|nr:YafY family protein [Thermobifida cellulosilytica]KUP97451.1 DeoR faimly transcriptional regulator [Thermobifida cellulosilytica TB100]
MPGRLLRLLSLLQGRREWSGAELAERLGVSTRTVRRDVDRLRALDYPVESAPGTAGGYRLVAGRDLPPLLLDDEEAVAVALGLVLAGGSGVAGLEETAVRALAKLERVLPARLRPRLAALGGSADAVPARGAPRVDPAVLAVLAACCRDTRTVAFDYRDRRGTGSARRVEPLRLVAFGGRWYLVAYDPAREDWRSFRVDRITGPRPSHDRFCPRPLPAPDAVAYLTRSFAAARYRHTARLEVALGADAVRSRLFAHVPGEIEPRGPRACAVRLSAESAELVAQYVAAIAVLDADVAVVDASEEVGTLLRGLGERLVR